MLVKTPFIFKKIFSNYFWKVPTHDKIIYLTFDDGPTPEITTKVLDILSEFGAKATFFCIGDNIKKYPEIFDQIIKSKHVIGNHTYNHIKGWKTHETYYIDNVLKTQTLISSKLKTQNSKLFRPPYGRIKPSQSKSLRKLGYKIIMWDVLSYDWQQSLDKDKVLRNVINNSSPGSIIVFHDSLKASKNVLYALPKVLKYFTEKGYNFKAIT